MAQAANGGIWRRGRELLDLYEMRAAQDGDEIRWGGSVCLRRGEIAIGG
jgi:hypothetical protein